MTNVDAGEKLTAVAMWLCAGTTECLVHVIEKNVAFGIGDSEDPIEVRKDRMRTLWNLKIFGPPHPEGHGFESGTYDSMELARRMPE